MPYSSQQASIQYVLKQMLSDQRGGNAQSNRLLSGQSWHECQGRLSGKPGRGALSDR